MSGETRYPVVHESDRKVPRNGYDVINPPHYRAANGIESIDVIEAFFPTNPYRWPVLKYIFRAGRKPGQDEVQDLRKAIWWIEREIAAIERRWAEPLDANGRPSERLDRPGRRADY